MTECVLIATDTRLAGEQAARRAGLEPRIVIGKRDCAGGLGSVRRAARDAGLRTTVIHSRDWERVLLPQLFELAALRIGAGDCRVLLGDGSEHRSLSRTRLALHVLRLPFDALAGLAGAGAEVVRFRRSRRSAPASARAADGDGVLAIWPGAGAAVGGAVTHVSGVVAAFRNAGL